jgi:magnesium transporter
MARKRTLKRPSTLKHSLGQVPGAVVYTGKKTDEPLYLDVLDYTNEELIDLELNEIHEAFDHVSSERVSWLNVNGLNHVAAIEEIGAHFDLHPLILEDIANTQQRPKIDEYENYFFVVLKMLYLDDQNQMQFEHLSLVLGKNYVVSFQEAEGDVFDSVRTRIRNSKGRIRSMSSDYLLYALMDAVVDHYFFVLEQLGERIELLEDDLFQNTAPDDITQEIQELKREILRIRRAIFPLREVVNRLEKSEHKLIHKKTQIYLRDLYDHIIQVAENVEIYRDMIWGLMDMYMTTISNKMNEVMKVLTIIATIFIPLTFMAGIYGMNFENIPELSYKYGYHILWGIMIVVFVGMLFYFRRKKWL